MLIRSTRLFIYHNTSSKFQTIIFVKLCFAFTGIRLTVIFYFTVIYTSFESYTTVYHHCTCYFECKTCEQLSLALDAFMKYIADSVYRHLDDSEYSRLHDVSALWRETLDEIYEAVSSLYVSLVHSTSDPPPSYE